MKNFGIFHLKTFIFLVVKFSAYLNRLVLVMSLRGRSTGYVSHLQDSNLIGQLFFIRHGNSLKLL